MADISTIPTEELLRMRQTQPTGSIQDIPTEQLLQFQQQRQQIQQDQRVSQLLDQLGGRLPGRDPIPVAAFPGPVETQRRRAFQELLALDFTPKQIELTVQAQRMLGGPRIGRGAGGVLGAIGATALAGRFIPGPIDDVAIMIALIAAGGAGISGVAGEAIQTGIQEKRLIGKREALKAFVIEAGTELGGRGAVRAGKFFAGPFIKKTVPEAAALIDDFAKVGGAFSPTELDRRFTLRIGEAFSRGGFGAREIFQEFEERQGSAALVFANNIIDALGEGIARQPIREIGEEFAKGITKPGGRVFNMLDDLFDPLYAQLDELVKESTFGFRQIRKGGVVRGVSGRFIPAKELQRIRTGAGVSTKSLKAFAQRIKDQNKRLVAVAKRTGRDLPLLSPAGKKVLKDIDNMPETLRHLDYRAFRTKVLKESRKLNRDLDVSDSMVKQISNVTRKELLDPVTVSNTSVETRRLHANISRLYSSSQDILEKEFSEKLAKRLVTNPSSVLKEIIPEGNPKGMEILRKSLVEPIQGIPSAEGKVLWNQVRQAWLADIVDQATKEGVVNPRLYNNLLRKMGRPAFNEMFPEPAIRQSVDKIQNLFTIVGKAPPTGASLFSRGAQTLGVVKMWQGAKAADFIGITHGGLLAIGPLAFAKLATSPKGVKFLTTGFRLKPGASGLVPNAVRMVRLLREINQKENRQRKAFELRKAALTRIRRAPTAPQLRGFRGRGF